MSKIIKQFKLWSLLLSALLLLPFCFACNAGTAAGANLLNIEGEVLVKKAGTSDWVTAKVDMELKAGDVVKAGNAADAVVTFFDGSTIELKADTQVEIQELVQGKTTSIRLQQVIGESISRVKKLVDPASRYEIETPAAIAGVRGTIMSVTVAENGTTIVGNEEGLVSVTAQGKEVLIPKGKHSIINPGETPSEPLEGTTSTIVSTPVQSIVGDFSTNGDAISGWYWLRDSALQQYAQWIAPSLMMNSNSLNLQITALATNAMSGGRGYDANFLLYYGIFQGKPTQVDTSKLKMVQVNLPNVSPTSDPVGYTCEGTVTLQGVEFTAGSVLVIRVVRESPDANHVAFNKDSISYSP